MGSTRQNNFPTINEVHSRLGVEEIDFDKLRVRDFDPYLGHQIMRLIYKDKVKIIYLDEKYIVQWATSFEKLPEGSHPILNRATEIQEMPMDCLTQENIIKLRLYVGEAVARALDNYLNEANKFLDKAELWIKMRNEEVCRLWQLIGSFITTAIAISSILLISLLAKQWISLTMLEIFYGGCAGCFGAFLSLVSRTGTLKLDPAAGRRIHIFEGIMRIIAGGGSAIFVAFGIKANLLLGTINNAPFQFELLMAFCIVAGFSERFVPSLVERMEDQSLPT